MGIGDTMKKKGLLIIISGFSGAGKGTIVKHLLENGDYSLSISATTREPRQGEVHGVHYNFITRDVFEKMISQDELVEWATYCNNYYGTPKKYVEEMLEDGKDVILEIEMQGALQVKKKFPDSMLIFVTAPSAQEIKNRLVGRGTESSDIIEKRLKKSYEEIDSIDNYDYIVINDGLEDTLDKVRAIIVAEHERVLRNKHLKSQLKHEFNQLLKGVD
jgi:guanylate kinase